MIIEGEINLDLTINSGQTSQPPWRELKGTYSDVVILKNTPSIFNVEQSGSYIDFNCDNLSDEAVLRCREIFDLDFDLDKFYKYLENHDELKDMTKFCRGLRIFRAKDPFECIISSICSANNSIKRWTNSIKDIKKNWGEKYSDYYTFPSQVVLGNVYSDEADEISSERVCRDLNLKSCGVGYRSDYIKKACEFEFISDIAKMDYDEAFECILEIPGVGPKVADCILLYGFNFKEAFPSDVWIKRIVSYLYFDGKDISVDKVRNFGMDEFGDYAGYVQLYMFHYARKSGLTVKLK